jgi:hypothetical protein
VSSPIKRGATYDDLLKVEPHLVAEIVDGDLHASPRDASLHVRARLGGQLTGPFDRGWGGPGGWWIIDEPELHLGPDVLVPDLAGWRRVRMPGYPAEPAFTEAPDWVCEVVSPAAEQLDPAKKLPAYAREKVAHLWLVDPSARTLEAYRLEDGRWTLSGTFAGSAPVRVPPFDALELALAGLWAEGV